MKSTRLTISQLDTGLVLAPERYHPKQIHE